MDSYIANRNRLDRGGLTILDRWSLLANLIDFGHFDQAHHRKADRHLSSVFEFDRPAPAFLGGDGGDLRRDACGVGLDC